MAIEGLLKSPPIVFLLSFLILILLLLVKNKNKRLTHFWWLLRFRCLEPNLYLNTTELTLLPHLYRGTWNHVIVFNATNQPPNLWHYDIHGGLTWKWTFIISYEIMVHGRFCVGWPSDCVMKATPQVKKFLNEVYPFPRHFSSHCQWLAIAQQQISSASRS